MLNNNRFFGVLSVFFILCSLYLIKLCDLPLLGNYEFLNMFLKPDTDYSVTLSITTGFVVSYMFYLITFYIPSMIIKKEEEVKLLDSKKKLYLELTQLIRYNVRLLDFLYSESGENLDIKYSFEEFFNCSNIEIISKNIKATEFKLPFHKCSNIKSSANKPGSVLEECETHIKKSVELIISGFRNLIDYDILKSLFFLSSESFIFINNNELIDLKHCKNLNEFFFKNNKYKNNIDNSCKHMVSIYNYMKKLEKETKIQDIYCYTDDFY